MSQLYYHMTPVKYEGVGPTGMWLACTICGERFLVPSAGNKPWSTCVNSKPIWGEDPCSRCGWESNVIKVEVEAREPEQDAFCF